MSNIHLIIRSCFVFLWLCLPSPGHCQVTVNEVINSPPQPIENGNVTLPCYATGFDPNIHLFSWQRYPNVDVIPDHRISIGPAILFADTEIVKVYSQNLTITNLTKSDEGIYLCVITSKDKMIIITNGQGDFTVNSTEEFPVCFPDGPAVVNEGDILTCRTVIDERSAVVSDTENPVERPSDWVYTSLAVNETGSRLQKGAIVSDDGVTFFCFSVIPENLSWTSLSCKIGPLKFIPDPLTTPTTPRTVSTPGLSVGAIISITFNVILFVVLVTILVLYFVYRRQMGIKTTSATGPNHQNPPHVYATAILEDTQPSSAAKAELHNYANVNPSTANHGGAHKNLSRPEPSSNTSSNPNESMRTTDPYMELRPKEPKHDVYTELKL